MLILICCDYQIEHPIIFASGTKNLTMHLKNVATKQSKVIVFGGR